MTVRADATGPHEFFRVGKLIPSDQDVVSVEVGCRVGEALELMKERDFDQLPVVTAQGRVIGVLTYRSLARALQHVRTQDNPLTQPVDDFVEDLHFVRTSDDVSEIFGHILQDNAVLIGDEDRLLAVATSSDVTRFLWDTTRPFVLLQDIELAIRDLMRSACSDDELHACVRAALPDAPVQVTPALTRLSLGELLMVLLSSENFGTYFRHRFGGNRDLVRGTLEPVRAIRNKVFHFQDDVSGDDLQSLADVVAWLRRKILIRDGV